MNEADTTKLIQTDFLLFLSLFQNNHEEETNDKNTFNLA